jgi:Sec-independent protein translocase protein TatA
MGGIGFSELLVVGVVALVVCNPKDLPALLRTLGRARARLGHLRAQFQHEMHALEHSIKPGPNARAPGALPLGKPAPPSSQITSPTEAVDGAQHGTRTDP